MTSPLGRGLGSLIPHKTQNVTPQPPQRSDTPVHVLPIAVLSPNPDQPRSFLPDDGLEELAASIREHGILQPLIVTPHGESFQIIAGERRYQAARRAGLQMVPVIVREAGEQERLELGLVENLQRQDLNALEEAEAYQRLADEFNLTQERIAQRVGKSRSYIANTIRLRGLPAEAKEAIRKGLISEGHAKVLLSLESDAEQLAFLNTVINQKLSVRASEAVAKARGARRRQMDGVADPNLQGHAEALQRRFGTKVFIRSAGNQGKIIIEFYSREELVSLVGQLTED